MSKRFRLIAIVCALLLPTALSGCAQANVEDPTGGLEPGGQMAADNASSEEFDPSTIENLLTIGTQSETATGIVLTNETGTELVGLELKDAQSTSYEVQLFGQGDRWLNDQTALIYAELNTTQPEVALEGREGGGVVLNILYDIRLTQASGAILELHAVNLQTFTDARIRIEGDIAYLVYLEGDNEASTLEAEQNR